jgi:tetratricopeptide (TPR) repeat protein
MKVRMYRCAPGAFICLLLGMALSPAASAAAHNSSRSESTTKSGSTKAVKVVSSAGTTARDAYADLAIPESHSGAGATMEIENILGDDPGRKNLVNPEDLAQPLLKKAQAAIQKEDWATGESLLREILIIDSVNVNALWALALLLLERKLPEKAVEPLETLLNLDPFHDDARFLLGRTYQEIGRNKDAKITFGVLFERHPQFPAAASIVDSFGPGAIQKAESMWQYFARFGLTSGYDSNVTLQNGALNAAAKLEAALAQVEVLAGLYRKDKLRSLNLLFYLSSQTHVWSEETLRTPVEQLMPTVVGARATGRVALGSWTGRLDVGYTELFTQTFLTHLGRTLSPSTSLRHKLGRSHVLEIGFGSDLYLSVIEGAELSTSLKSWVRDRMRFGALSLVLTTNYRHNLNTSKQDLLAASTGFNEGGANVYTDWRVIGGLALYGYIDGRGRWFVEEQGDRGQNLVETSLAGQLGLRYTFNWLEMYVSYAYSQTLSGQAIRRNKRHQGNLGFRVWYP